MRSHLEDDSTKRFLTGHPAFFLMGLLGPSSGWQQVERSAAPFTPAAILFMALHEAKDAADLASPGPGRTTYRR